MLILALETSAIAASAAIMEDDNLLGEFYVRTKQKHSETLMPMIQNLLAVTKKEICELDLFAVAAGPGSFTGVRIGISCVKGMAFIKQTPCASVSTLLALAYAGSVYEGKFICAVMDARRGQVYQALFHIQKGTPQRLSEDKALSILELEAICKQYGDKLIFIGDGAPLCHEALCEFGAKLAYPSICNQSAQYVALAAAEYPFTQYVQAQALSPIYLRLPQAVRELKLKEKKNDSIGQ